MTAQWASKIDQITADFNTSFGGLTTEQLNWKPNPDTWSVAQNIEHLIIINESYYPILTALHEGKYKTPWIGRIGFIVNLFGKTVFKAVDPARRKKMKTFPIWEPSTGKVPGTILAKFEKHQADLKQRIQASQALPDKHVVIASPANSNVVYRLGTAFDIIVAHEQRHLEQAKEVLQELLSRSKEVK